MRKKRQEFIDLKQGGRSVHDYYKQFNHLAQYASDQVKLPAKLSGFIMCFMSPNSRDVLSLQQMWLLKTTSHWSLI
jgi:hypothetical protein